MCTAECNEECLNSPSDVLRDLILEPSGDAIYRAITAVFVEPDVLRRQKAGLRQSPSRISGVSKREKRIGKIKEYLD